MPATSTMPRRFSRIAIALLITALLLVWLPVAPVMAQEVPPQTKGETVDALTAEAGSNIEPQEGLPQLEQGPDDGSATADDDDASLLGAPEPAPSQLTEAVDDQDDDAEFEWQRSEPTEAPIPFTGLGFKGPGEAPQVRWRVQSDDGTWTAWQSVEPLDLHDGPDPASAEARDAEHVGDSWTSDAIWVGHATHLQVEVEGGSLDDVEVTVIDGEGLSESLGERFARRMRSLTAPAPAEASVGGPNIVSRAQWGANESWRSGSPRYAQPTFAVLHHTATTNDYTRAQAPGQVRNMYYWHTSGNGWADLGYNFVIDKYGTIYEGRHGGVDRGVIGAHAANYNTGSFGVAIMGNYNNVSASSSALNSLNDLLSWKYDIHWINPSASATVSYRGQTMPTLVGHRNVRGSYTANPSTTTDCPGQRLYTVMNTIRTKLASGSSKFSGGAWTPVTGDWNGNGTDSIGWYRDGIWRLRNSNASGSADMLFSFGTKGDLPVVGDWNGDGRTTVGIVREGQWHLRDTNSGGAADYSFWYGRGAIDYPMAGDWNGDGKDTPAIVRDGEWHLRNALAGGRGDIVFVYGRVLLGDVPVVGDWNGDGRDTPGILRDGTWHLRNTHSGGPGDWQFVYGRVTRGDVPIIGDWNGNGSVAVGVTRLGVWHLRNSLTGGPADLSFHY